MAIEYTAAALSDGIAETAARVRSSVVQVHAGRQGIGSGVVWSAGMPDTFGAADATIITNAHVVRAARGQELTVKFEDGTRLTAELVAVDPEHDLAALRVHGAGLHAAEIGDSSALRVGELVLAVGNPFGLEGAVTVGVVAARAPADLDINVEPADPADADTPRREGPPEDGSRRGRWGWGRGWPEFRRMDVIQADIRLYPGNSGGPLADARGRVVGINAMIGGGLAFAVPGRTVQQFLATAGRPDERPYLGVQVMTVPLPAALRNRHGLAQESAVLIMEVEPGGAADSAGLFVGDVLLAVDGAAVPDARLLPRVLGRGAASQSRTLTLLRGGARIETTLTPQVRTAA